MQVLIGSTGKRDWVVRLQEYGWGRMLCRDMLTTYPGEPWGLDNGAFGCWLRNKPFDGDGFCTKVEKALQREKPYLAVVPDKVGDGYDSLDFSERWRDELPDELPWFLAVQDGMAADDVQPLLGRYSGIFLGGTDAFKHTAGKWCALAHNEGILFHYGRAGTANKIRHARDVGADSLDSAFPLWTQARLETFARWIREGLDQRDLFSTERVTVVREGKRCAR